MKESRRCRLRLTRVALNGESIKIQFSQKLTGVGDTGESRLPRIAYTCESSVQPSKRVDSLKGTIPQKADSGY
jgi:hypothetical protein